MTMAAYAGTRHVADVATNRGWRDVVAYIRKTDVRVYPNAHHLIEFGWHQFVPETIQELDAITKQHPPKQSVDRTIQGLLAILRAHTKAAAVVISDGLS